jgi:SAM-dependent methyltransferase
MTIDSNGDVRTQYEALPYPARDPADEKRRLLRTWLDDLPMINHYCFAGRQSFDRGFRALVAGGGTGDGTIFLAEQLRHTDARIVHLDFSAASMAVAQARAAARGLTNIDWIHDSILNLPRLGLDPVDYINCIGVLHHLDDPDAGLQALRTVLKPEGALGLMVYAQIGRTGIYQMQDLMKLVNENGAGIEAQIAGTRQMLGMLPAGNWFKRGEDLYQDHRDNDAGLYDMLLHSCDRAYTVGQLFDWIADRHGLNLEFSSVYHGRSAYLPHLRCGPQVPPAISRLAAQAKRRQYEAAELLSGQIITHDFYATGSPELCAPYGQADYVPFFYHEPVTGPELSKIFRQSQGRPFLLNHTHTGIKVMASPGKYVSRVLFHIDGNKTFREIFERVRHDDTLKGPPPDDAALFADFAPVYELFNSIERLLLRHPSATLPRQE